MLPGIAKIVRVNGLGATLPICLRGDRRSFSTEGIPMSRSQDRSTNAPLTNGEFVHVAVSHPIATCSTSCNFASRVLGHQQTAPDWWLVRASDLKLVYFR